MVLQRLHCHTKFVLMHLLTLLHPSFQIHILHINSKMADAEHPGSYSRQLPVLLVWLQDDGVHDEWNEVCYILVHLLLVQLEHEHHNDGQLCQHLQGQHCTRYQVVLQNRNTVEVS